MSPFLINKGILIDNEISLIHNGKTTNYEKHVAETLNHAYITIIKYTTGNKPTSVLYDTDIELSSAINFIINKYEAHPSIVKIKDTLNSPTCFIINKVNVLDVEKLLKRMKVDKASLEDKVPPRLIKMAYNLSSEPITDIINTAIDTNTFLDRAKKHLSLQLIKVGIISTFSLIIDQLVYQIHSQKIIDLSIFDRLAKHANHFLSIFLSASRQMCDTQQVLIRLLVERREQLDHNEIVGTVLMDLFKTFACIRHDLLIAKLNACGFGQSTLQSRTRYMRKTVIFM